MAWTIPFESTSGRQMRLLINGEGTGTITAGANPFILEQDDDDDLFKPVRTATGYITVVCTFDVIKEIVAGAMPTSRSVVLFTDENTVLWRGYIRCETFNFDYTPFVQEFQLPIVNRLELIQDLPLAKTLGYTSVPQFFQEMQWSYGYFYIPDGYLSYLLSYDFNRANYFTERDYPDADGSMYDAECMGKVLEDICNYFGWQCQEVGTDLVFTSNDNCTKYRKYTLSDLLDESGTYTTANREVLALPAIVSADNSVSIIPGKKTIEVSGDMNAYDTDVYSFDPESDLVYTGSNDSFGLDSLNKTHYTTRKYESQIGTVIEAYQFLAGTLTSATVNNIKYSNALAKERTYEGAAIANEGLFGDGDSYDNNYTNRLILTNLTGSNHVTPLVKIHPWRVTYRDVNAALKISCSAKYVDDARGKFKDGFTGKVRGYFICNGKYFNENSGWNDTKTPFNLTFEDGKLVTTNHEAWYGEDDGYFIGWGDYDQDIANSQFTLQLIAVYGSDGTTLVNGYVALESFKIAVHYDTIWTYAVKDTNEYKKVLSNGFPDDASVSCGLTYKSTGQVGRGVMTIKPFDKRPEVYLGERMVDYYSKSHAMFKVVVRGNEYLSPINTIMMHGYECAIIGQSLDYRYEELTLTLLALT